MHFFRPENTSENVAMNFCKTSWGMGGVYLQQQELHQLNQRNLRFTDIGPQGYLGPVKKGIARLCTGCVLLFAENPFQNCTIGCSAVLSVWTAGGQNLVLKLLLVFGDSTSALDVSRVQC